VSDSFTTEECRANDAGGRIHSGEGERFRPASESAVARLNGTRRAWMAKSAVMILLAVGCFALCRILPNRVSLSRFLASLANEHAFRVLNIAILVFREGLECILVLAALTASFKGGGARYSRQILWGVLCGAIATVMSWAIAIHVLNDLTKSVPALALQAATGLLAIVVLLVVMNWFFHKMYWTGWISFHNRQKDRLLQKQSDDGGLRLGLGMALLGFTSFYREGFEVVLFLQSFRLQLGGALVGQGVAVGACATAIVAVLTFVAHRHLAYRKMLVATGVMLACVLIVMVGEEAQEMQLAGWLPTTPIARLAKLIPSWAGMWFSVFPTLETLTAQLLAAALVFGSYFTAQRISGISR
jgi:high-affinity iron transporter